MELNDLYEKYNVLTDGLDRRYVLNPFERRYDMDHVTPIELHFVFEIHDKLEDSDLTIYSDPIDKTFKCRSWSQLVLQIVNFLQKDFPKSIEELLNFKSDWSKARVFSEDKCFDNMLQMENGLYLSINYTSTHFLWIIGDLLDFYGIGCGALIVHRPPKAEPQEIREAVEEYRKNRFKQFLLDTYETINEEKADRVVKSVKSLNKVLDMMGTSYDNFYLFQSAQELSNYKSRLLLDHKKYVNWDEAKLKTAKKYLDHLTNYYAYEARIAKRHKDELELYSYVI